VLAGQGEGGGASAPKTPLDPSLGTPIYANMETPFMALPA